MIRNLFLGLAWILFAGVAYAHKDPVTVRPGQNATAPAAQAPAATAPVAAVPVVPAPAVQAPVAAAPTPQAPRSIVPGSEWRGTEDYNNNGGLIFRLRRNGSAEMVDANNNAFGRWTATGNEVVIVLNNCVYRGRVVGNQLVGRGAFTSGAQAGLSWAFRVTYHDPFGGHYFSGNEAFNNNGRLSFAFGTNGTVTMIDARSTVQGAYTRDANDVTIRFNNCIYIGTLQSNGVITGTATFLNQPETAPWTFTVSK